MPQIYRLSKTGTRLLYKIRHHKGHGIHSPFVYHFINRVIEEKTHYYAYDDIRHHLEQFPCNTYVENKVNRLIFKTVNYFNPKSILELGAGNGLNTLYLTVTASDMLCASVELDVEKQKKAQNLHANWDRSISYTNEPFPRMDTKVDCIYLNLRNYHPDFSQLISYLLSLVENDSFIFIDGIRTNRRMQMLWRMLVERQEVIVSLDLFDVGILFFDKKYFKRNYKLSF